MLKLDARVLATDFGYMGTIAKVIEGKHSARLVESWSLEDVDLGVLVFIMRVLL